MILWQDLEHAEALIKEGNPDKMRYWAELLIKHFVYTQTKDRQKQYEYICGHFDELQGKYCALGRDPSKFRPVYDKILSEVQNEEKVFFNDRPIVIYEKELSFIKSFWQTAQRQRHLWVWLLFHKAYNNNFTNFREWVPMKDKDLMKYVDKDRSSTGDDLINVFRYFGDNGFIKYRMIPGLDLRKDAPKGQFSLSYVRAHGEEAYRIEHGFESPLEHLDMLNDPRKKYRTCAVCGTLFSGSGRQKYCGKSCANKIKLAQVKSYKKE